MKSFKKIISILLAVIMLFAVGVSAFAEDDSAEEKKITIYCQNVAGLPIPSMFADDGKVIPKTQKIMGKMLNEIGADVICVQEDFQYHSVLAAQMTNYPYQTYTSGGIPVGDGLNIFSKYPIYNIERVAWEQFNGILDAANDGLTPKGFLKVTVDFDGLLVDVYDIHADANGSYEDCMAKKAQFTQLSAYIDENSAGRPVAITGDYNALFHGDIAAELYPIMIQGAGFSDAWTLYCNDGVYFTSYLPADVVAEYDKKWGGYYWGHWDSVERLLFRDGDGTKMTVTNHKYVDMNAKAGQPVTDHNGMFGELTVDMSEYVRPEIQLNTEIKKSPLQSFKHAVDMYIRCFKLLFTDLFDKLASGELTK